MINWSYYPKHTKITKELEELKEIFVKKESDISSSYNNLHSDGVLKLLESDLESIGYSVEKSKSPKDKIRIPVLYGYNGKEEVSFEVDAFLKEKGIVLEVEAGRAVANYQFLKDFFEACCMVDINYLCIAIRNVYLKSNDYKTVCSFFDAWFASRKNEIQLKGILIIGY